MWSEHDKRKQTSSHSLHAAENARALFLPLSFVLKNKLHKNYSNLSFYLSSHHRVLPFCMPTHNAQYSFIFLYTHTAQHKLKKKSARRGALGCLVHSSTTRSLFHIIIWTSFLTPQNSLHSYLFIIFSFLRIFVLFTFNKSASFSMTLKKSRGRERAAHKFQNGWLFYSLSFL